MCKRTILTHARRTTLPFRRGKGPPTKPNPPRASPRKYRNSKANQMLFISAVNYYFDTLAAAASNYVLNPDHDNKAGIDVTAQRNAWIGSGKAEAADWDDATVMATPFKRMVYLAGDVQILGCMGGLEFAVTLM